MAKHKKKRAAPAPAKPKEPGPFNPAFAGLKASLDAAPAEPAPAPPPPAPPEPEPDDLRLFDQAMAEVKRLERGSYRPQRPDPNRPRLEAAPDEDLEVLAQLADLVSGGAEFDLRMSDEYVRGSLPGVGPELLERLARGDFPVQDYLDLHGFSLEEAFPAVEEFLVRSLARGLRHVLIVHGRGLSSPGGTPVLKTALTQWLGQKRLQKRVLAFCTALARDGGAGAVYVLLRKWQSPGGRW
ncbi:MAG: Smr/MutS family protein [Thermodesulfobacteriota bacterium]